MQRKARRTAILLAAALAAILGGGAASDAPAFQPHRGIGVYRPFNWLRDGARNNSLFQHPWNCFFGPVDFERLKKAGFDTVRIFMEPEVFWRLDAAGQQKAREDAGSLINALNASGLKVVFAFGATPGRERDAKVLTRDPNSDEFKAYRTAVTGMAQYLNGFDPAKVAFELFNEPPGPCDWGSRPSWHSFQELIYHDARQAAPRLTLILTGPCAAAVESFKYLPADADYVKDPNTIFIMHYYDPYDFTLQSQNRRKYLTEMPYPADPSRRAATEAAVRARIESAPDLDSGARPAATAEAMKMIGDYFNHRYDAAYIDRKFDLVEDWRQKANVPASRIVVGEFGVVRQQGPNGVPAANNDDRVRWYGLVRRAAEKRGYGWIAWSYFGDMSIFDDDPPHWQTAPRHLNPGLLDALGLSQSANSITGTSAIGGENPMACR